MIETFEQYYIKNFKMWVDSLSKKIGNREEAEDRVQDIFMSLSTRKEFCKGILKESNFHKYIKGAIMRQRANFFEARGKHVPTIRYGDVDFSVEIAESQQDNGTTEEIELNDFYETAVKLLADPRKSRLEKFNTVGEFRQYVFVQHIRNGRTFEEIKDLIGVTSRNFWCSRRIATILMPLCEKYFNISLRS